MALSSTLQSSLKLPTTLLLLVAVFGCLLSECESFQQLNLPVFGGARPSCCRRCLLCRPSLPRTDNDDEKEELLIEQENPEADFDRKSLSGIRYGSVFDSLHILYPPSDLEKRNAVSRSDGYWPFINSGEEPPKQFTYGEFDLYFFAELLDRALDYYNEYQDEECSTWDGKVLTDVGSGTGRLVFAAAALHPGWKLCRGVEVLESIHRIAVETLEKCRYKIDTAAKSDESSTVVNLSEEHDKDAIDDNVSTTWRAFGTPFGEEEQEDDWLNDLREQYNETPSLDNTDSVDDECEGGSTPLSSGDEDCTQKLKEDDNQSFDLFVLPAASENSDGSHEEEMLCLAPIEFTCGSFQDPYEYIGDSDLIFVFSSCMSSDMMSSLSKAFGLQCKPGTIIITTDYFLPLSGDIGPLEDDESMPFGPYELVLLESIDGFCWLTGGQSTAFIHKVVSSLWEEGVGPRQKPVLSLEEVAYRVVKAYEAGELTDTNKFLREVRNAMVFQGLPESWLPSADD